MDRYTSLRCAIGKLRESTSAMKLTFQVRPTEAMKKRKEEANKYYSLYLLLLLLLMQEVVEERNELKEQLRLLTGGDPIQPKRMARHSFHTSGHKGAGMQKNISSYIYIYTYIHIYIYTYIHISH